MLRSVSGNRIPGEGYVYVVYGNEKYLKHAVASLITLRRYDAYRPVALICEPKHRDILIHQGLGHLFDHYFTLDEQHRSIVGFKHNIHHYLIFEKNLYLDSDIIWCKNPDTLWKALSPFSFTITGNLVADTFFGGRKDIGILKEVFLNRRKKTLENFALSYLSRVQSGMIYAQNAELSAKVCTMASHMLARKEETHFKSRILEHGRSEESCEWSLAMAMSHLNIPVYPWLQGLSSPQLDFIEDLTEYDADFELVKCKYYCNSFVYSFRGLKSVWFRTWLTKLFSLFPGNGDYMMVTPYCLHFGWYHQKQPFFKFSDLVWQRLTSSMQHKEVILASRSVRELAEM